MRLFSRFTQKKLNAILLGKKYRRSSMKKKISIGSLGRKSPNVHSTLADTAEEAKRWHPRRSSEIDAFVADLREQIALGGVAVQEAQIALMTAFPLKAPVRKSMTNNKGYGGKR
jgi:hypothetical protein